jgi:hypothetical protein
MTVEAIILEDWCPYKKRKRQQRVLCPPSIEVKLCEDMARMWPCKEEGPLPERESAHSSTETSHLQNCEKINI